MANTRQTIADGYRRGPDGRKRAREAAVAAVVEAATALEGEPDELDAFRAEIAKVLDTPATDDGDAA